jgi:ribosomal protein S18 acetylase RimI-like enzyme
MEQNYSYRHATLADKKQLIALALISYGQYATELEAEHLERMNRNISNDENWTAVLTVSKSVVCLDGDKIIGMAFLIPHGNPWDIFKAEWSYLRLVGVDPGYQGKGIAKMLTQKCIEHAIALKEKTIALHTSEMMHAARHIYESAGFTILKEIEPRLGKRYWIYTLALNSENSK